ncbi:FAD/NAD(P)-binding protein [Seohaeicola zhoushanensis]|uniref:FAD-dependent oxidoreductase n=1 Tax=Seohaeicola zhoushanensis TaxID=1569283 RepID=A0A8J3M7V3_9RHOB|nr:FAD/NAD(P)-binding protein [Seohaeicola zhoushanensis]GHF55391.1 FAD-dependent oxidoreductase [Seohaeicola zhoushanensis]
MRRFIILGGGFTGAATAIQLARHATDPLDICIVEPRETVGGGIAYGGNDPDHRVNGTHELLILFPEDLGHFARWYAADRGLERDPEAFWPATGVTFVRRSDVRRYLGGMVAELARENPSGSRIRHQRGRAVAVARQTKGLKVTLEDGLVLDADTLVLAAAGQSPSVPRGVSAKAAGAPGFIADPLRSGALDGPDRDASVLLVGTGLTAADVIASLARRGHRGPICAISRRGLRPQPQGAAPDIAKLVERLARPMPRFLERHGSKLTLMQTYRALRADLALAEAQGGDAKSAFDDVRDAAARLWPGYSLEEQGRFLRHLKPWYDVYRYRMVPQTGAVLDHLESTGQLTFRRSRFLRADLDGSEFVVTMSGGSEGDWTERFDAIVLCTGPRTLDHSPLFASLQEAGIARPDLLGLGIEVDAENRVHDRDGRPQDDVFAYGLLTRGAFGDMTAIPQIAFRLNATIPALLRRRPVRF